MRDALSPFLRLFLCAAAVASYGQPPPPEGPNKPRGLVGSALDQKPQPAKPDHPGGSRDLHPPNWKAGAAPPSVSTGIAGAAAARGLSFDARSLTSGAAEKEDTVVQTKDGQPATARLRKSKTTIEVQVRNIARERDTAHLDWFFLAKDVRTGSTFVSNTDWRDVTLPPAGQKKEIIESEEVVSAVTRTTSGKSTTETKSGARPSGWIVRMFVSDKLVKVQASTPALEQIGRDPVQIERLVKEKPVAPAGAADGR